MLLLVSLLILNCDALRVLLCLFLRMRIQNITGCSRYRCLVGAYSGTLMIFCIVLNFIIFQCST